MKKGNLGGLILALISTIILFFLWIFTLESINKFKYYYFAYLFLYFIILSIAFGFINILTHKLKRFRMILSVLHGIWLSVILAFLSTFLVIIIESGMCTGSHCGEIGMAAPFLIVLFLIVFLVPNILFGFISGYKGGH